MKDYVKGGLIGGAAGFVLPPWVAIVLGATILMYLIKTMEPR